MERKVEGGGPEKESWKKVSRASLSHLSLHRLTPRKAGTREQSRQSGSSSARSVLSIVVSPSRFHHLLSGASPRPRRLARAVYSCRQIPSCVPCESHARAYGSLTRPRDRESHAPFFFPNNIPHRRRTDRSVGSQQQPPRPSEPADPRAAMPAASTSRPKRRSSIAASNPKSGKSVYAEVPSSDPSRGGREDDADEEVDQLASSQVNTPVPSATKPSPNKLQKKSKKQKKKEQVAAPAKEMPEDEKAWLAEMLARKQAALLRESSAATGNSTPAPATPAAPKSQSKQVKDSVGKKSIATSTPAAAGTKQSKTKKKVTVVDVRSKSFSFSP